jgi:hypothetical protein
MDAYWTTWVLMCGHWALGASDCDLNTMRLYCVACTKDVRIKERAFQVNENYNPHNIPWRSTVIPEGEESPKLTPVKAKEWKWRVAGDGTYFAPFWVEAFNMREAWAHASDILAGSDTVDVGSRYKRFYGTVDTHIVSITREDKVNL